jgi:TRAP-type C4-dicarboxylate transport system permease small subunit
MKEQLTALGAVKKTFKIADRIIFNAVKWISLACFVLLFILVMANVIVRIFKLGSIHYYDEIQVWALGMMIFYGAAGLWILRDHFKLDVLKKVLFDKHPVVHGFFNLFVEFASLFFIGLFAYESYQLSVLLMGETNYFRIPEKHLYLFGLFIPGVIMVVYSLRNIAVCVWDLVRAFRPKPDVTVPPDPTAVPPDQTVVAQNQSAVPPA